MNEPVNPVSGLHGYTADAAGVLTREVVGMVSSTDSFQEEGEAMTSEEKRRYTAALKAIDFRQAFGREVSNSNTPHTHERIDFGRFYREMAQEGFDRAVLNVAQDLKL